MIAENLTGVSPESSKLPELPTSSSGSTLHRIRSPLHPNLNFSTQPARNDEEGDGHEEGSDDSAFIKQYYLAQRLRREIFRRQAQSWKIAGTVEGMWEAVRGGRKGAVIQGNSRTTPSSVSSSEDGGVALPGTDDGLNLNNSLEVTNLASSPKTFASINPVLHSQPISTLGVDAGFLPLGYKEKDPDMARELAKESPEMVQPNNKAIDHGLNDSELESKSKEKGKEKMLRMRAERKRLADLRKTDYAKWCEEIAILDQIKREDEIIRENVEREESRNHQQESQDKMWLAEIENAVTELSSLRENLEEVRKLGEEVFGKPRFDKGEQATTGCSDMDIDGDWEMTTLRSGNDGTETIFISTYFNTESSDAAASKTSSVSEANVETKPVILEMEDGTQSSAESVILQPRPVRLLNLPMLLGTYKRMTLFPQLEGKIDKADTATELQSISSNKDEIERRVGSKPVTSTSSKAYAVFKLLLNFLKSRRVWTPEGTFSTLMPKISAVLSGLRDAVSRPQRTSVNEPATPHSAKIEHGSAVIKTEELDIPFICNVRVECQRRHSLVKTERTEFIEDHAFLPKSLRSRKVVDKEQERMKYEEEQWKMRMRCGVV